jgi:hypothetical protein
MAGSAKTLSVLLLVAVAGCKQEETVSYSQNVKPVLDKYCMECHKSGGPGVEASGFSMDSYADLMKGATNGPMIIAGDPLGSNMLVLMEGRADPAINMPHNQEEGATEEEIDAVRIWIAQGAKNN